MNGKQTPMMRTNAAVAGLNKVSGFDPVKLLQSTLDSRTADKDEEVRLKLRYKKLWFRLAYPQGRIRLSALRLTEQLAIIEARIYFHKDDTEPVANFTAERKAQDTPLYIQAAQYEAQDNALTDAGFGIQLCDVCQAMGEEAYTSKQPENAESEQTVMAPATSETNLEQPSASSEERLTEAAEGVSIENAEPEQAAPVIADDPVTAAEAPAETGQEQTPPEIPSADEAPSAAPAETITPAEEQPAEEPAPALEADGPEAETPPVDEPAVEMTAVPAQENGGYSPNMTVDEIAARMTLDEAMGIIADVGMCQGQTLARIADKRPASLRWYIVGCKEASNVLKAGAKLVLDSLSMQKSA